MVQAHQTISPEERHHAFRKVVEFGSKVLDNLDSEENIDIYLNTKIVLVYAHRETQEYETAIIILENLIPIYADIPNVDLVAKFRFDIGKFLIERGELERANKNYEKLVHFLQPFSSYDELKALAFNTLAETHLELNRRQEAQITVLKALKYAEKANNNFQLWSHTLNNAGHIFLRNGLFEKAINYYEKAIANLYKNQQPQLSQIAGIWGNIANVFRITGQYHMTIGALNTAISIAESANDALSTAKWLSTLGTLLSFLGEHDQAIQCHHAAKGCLSSKNDPKEILMQVSQNTGFAFYNQYIATGSQIYAEGAAEHFREVNEWAVDNNNYEEAGNTFGNLGLISLHKNEFEQAYQYFLMAISNFEQAQSDLGLCYVYDNLGQLYSRMPKEQNQAMSFFNRAKKIAESFQDVDALRQILGHKAYCHQVEGDIKNAILEYEAAVELVESNLFGRKMFAFNAHRIGFFSRNLECYLGLVKIHTSLNEHREAFNWAEKAHARVFLEQIGMVSQIHPSGIDDRVIDKEHALIKMMHKIEGQAVLTNDPRQRNHLAEKKEKVRKKLTAVWNTIGNYPAGKRYLALRQGNPVTATWVQEWVDQHPGTAILNFFTTADAIYIWRFIANQACQLVRIPCDFFEFRQNLTLLLDELTRPRPQFESQFISNFDLFQNLLSPIEEHLSAIEHLYIVAHGVLHSLPFHFLSLGGTSLIEHTAVTYLPTTGYLQFTDAVGELPQSKEGSLIMGYTSRENEKAIFYKALQQTADSLDSVAYWEEDATKEQFLQKAPKATIIYLLAHGNSVRSNSLDSFIELKNPLTAREIHSLNLNGAIVILASCEVGQSNVFVGDELSGFAHSFILSGAKAVVAANWAVEFNSSVQLVSFFLDNLNNPSFSVGKAFQEAVNRLKYEADSQFTHPFFWAPYRLYSPSGH